MRRFFPNINLSIVSIVSPKMGSVANESGKNIPFVIELAGPSQLSAPVAIVGSDVSVASTSSNVGEGNSVFLKLTPRLGTTSQSQTFATAVWKPKEPPCFFGRITKDAHTWVSLVRNYLTFCQVVTGNRWPIR